jgi:hypothetical protein
MRVGFNYPWPSNKVGLWIGPQDRQDKWPKNYETLWKDLPFKEQIAANLKILKDSGVEVVRWFIMGNGFNYGLPPQVTNPPPLFFGGDPSGRAPQSIVTFDPPDQLDPLFSDHFQQLLELHSSAQMQIIPSLLSFEFFSPETTSWSAAGGRADIATDAAKRNKFFFTVLADFLKVSDKYREWIYAWEVINEPTWDVSSFTPPTTGGLPLYHPVYVDLDSMRAFIRLACNWIEDKKFQSTVGHRFQSDLSIMPTGTLPQFHYYSEPVAIFGDPRTLPASRDAGAGIVGEFGALVGKGYELNEKPVKASYGEPWDRDFPDHRDRDPAQTVFDRLTLMGQLGYQLAIVWPDLNDAQVDAVDGLKISAQKLAQINKFVKG